MDFGGLGFVRLSQALSGRGHSVRWWSFGPQVERLNAHNCPAEDHPDMAHFALLPIDSADKIHHYPKVYDNRINALRHFLARLQAFKPDLIFVDRLLVGAALAIEQTEIPYFAVGTPGGHWRFADRVEPKRINIHPQNTAVEPYREYGGALKRTLSWSNGDITSAWVRSPLGNLHFMSRDFYPPTGSDQSISLFHHRPPAPPYSGNRLGVSFGNQGSSQGLKDLTTALIQNGPRDLGIDVFAGNDTDTRRHFQSLSETADLRVFGWTRFAGRMPDLSGLMFLGGVGSIWHCLNHAIPMVVAPGYIGDQLHNAQRVAALGLGLHLRDCDLTDPDQLRAIGQLAQSDSLRDKIASFVHPDSFDETMASFCDKVGARQFG